jgi:hypothetical protein
MIFFQELQCGHLQVFAGILLPTSFWCSIGHLKKKVLFLGGAKVHQNDVGIKIPAKTCK